MTGSAGSAGSHITANGASVWKVSASGGPWECYDSTNQLCNLVLEIFGKNDPNALTTGMKTIDLNQYWNGGSMSPALQYYNELASTLMYIDTANVAGGISTFNKAFHYQSGVDCTNCK